MKYLRMLVMVLFLFSPQRAISASDGTYNALRLFSDVLEEIESSYVEEVRTQELIEKAVMKMVDSLDPHSALLSPKDHDELKEDTKGKFSGVGLVLSIRDEKLVVVSPIEGSPAGKAGIDHGDIITSIAGEKTEGLTMDEAVKLMRGPRGSLVKLTVRKKGSGKEASYTLRRDEIPLRSVAHFEMKPGFPLVAISSFNDGTSEELRKALRAHEAQGEIKGLVLDLRDNPGGILQQAVEVVDLFIEKGVIVSIEGRDKEQKQMWQAGESDVARSFPMVVLINGGSASASEIVAGALKDHKRALILGTTSFGKGSVQNIISLSNGYGLKLTVALYYTPSGASIQARGIVPDVELPYQALEFEANEEGVTERDLPNHITLPDAKGGSELPKAPPQFRYDNQVQRALELLISRDIFGISKASGL